MSHRIGFSALFLAICLTPTAPALSQEVPFAPNLANVADGTEGKVTNRGVSATDKAGQPAVRFDERAGDGLVSWPDLEFSDGTIEFDVRGKDVLQKSFVGVAFHGLGETFEAVYFRPFNFRASDPARRSHAVQYIANPDYTWERLRNEHPGEYEKPLAPAPDPDSWVHARVVVEYPKVSVFVNGASEPSLVVGELSGRRTGWFGLWVGNGSGGDFANFKVSSVHSAKSVLSLQSPPIPDQEPGVTARIRAAVQDAMNGTMRRDDYAQELWSQLSPKQKDIQADLNSLHRGLRFADDRCAADTDRSFRPPEPDGKIRRAARQTGHEVS